MSTCTGGCNKLEHTGTPDPAFIPNCSLDKIVCWRRLSSSVSVPASTHPGHRAELFASSSPRLNEPSHSMAVSELPKCSTQPFRCSFVPIAICTSKAKKLSIGYAAQILISETVSAVLNYFCVYY